MSVPPPAGVAVMGGGLRGVTAAALLAARDRHVLLLGSAGEPGRTPARLTEALDARYYKPKRSGGAAAMTAVGAALRAAIDRIEALVRERSID